MPWLGGRVRRGRTSVGTLPGQLRSILDFVTLCIEFRQDLTYREPQVADPYAAGRHGCRCYKQVSFRYSLPSSLSIFSNRNNGIAPPRRP